MKRIVINKLTTLLYFLASIALLLGIWALVAKSTKNEVPSPLMTWDVFKEVMQNA